ncbi:MAG: PaaI family thioesterase [Pseudomonadales bacterium]
MSNGLPEGYKTDPGFDPAEDYIGPFYYAVSTPNQYAFVADDKHCNANGIVHGGVLMAFADYALCMAATNHYQGESCVTVSFNCEFVAAAQINDLIGSTVTVTRKTGSMVFLTGIVRVSDTIVMTFSAVVKRLIEKAGQ